MTPEGKFKIAIRDAIKDLPYSWIHIADAFLKKGIPDCMGAINGIPFAFELKVGTQVTEIQRLTLTYMRHAGYLVGIVKKRIIDKRRYEVIFMDELEELNMVFHHELEFAQYLHVQIMKSKVSTYQQPSVQNRVKAVLERIGYNVLDSHIAAIDAWVTSIDASVVSQTVAIIEKDYPGGMVASAAKKPLFSLLSGATPDIEKAIDGDILNGIKSLDSYLDAAATAGGA